MNSDSVNICALKFLFNVTHANDINVNRQTFVFVKYIIIVESIYLNLYKHTFFVRTHFMGNFNSIKKYKRDEIDMCDQVFRVKKERDYACRIRS